MKCDLHLPDNNVVGSVFPLSPYTKFPSFWLILLFSEFQLITNIELKGNIFFWKLLMTPGIIFTPWFLQMYTMFFILDFCGF